MRQLPEDRPSRTPASPVVRISFVSSVTAFLIAFVGYALGIRINLSGSIPPGIYRIVNAPVTRGAVVLVCLPPQTSAFARSRGFVPPGSCADGAAPIGKTIAALDGDTVDVGLTGVSVNGRRLPNSMPLRADSRGRPLNSYPAGRYFVGADDVWIVSSYSPASFDSRYFGPLDIHAITAHVHPLLTANWS